MAQKIAGYSLGEADILRRAMSKKKEEVLIKGAGRTDAKVHALNQYAHFDSNIYIPPRSLKKVLNKNSKK